MPEITDFKLREPIIINGKEIFRSGFFHYCHDPHFAPKGKSVLQTPIELTIFIGSSYTKKTETDITLKKKGY